MRVLVVSDDASLAVALSLTAEDREVVSVRSAGEVDFDDVESFDVTVVDVGTTYRGLEVIAELAGRGAATPCLLLGDVEAPLAHPDVHVLTRPLTLERLDERLSRLEPLREDASRASSEDPAARRFGALRGRFKRIGQAGRGHAPIRGWNVSNDDQPLEPTRATDLESAREELPPAAAARNGAARRATSSEVEAKPPGVAGWEPDQARSDATMSLSPQAGVTGTDESPRPQPRTYPRFRSKTSGERDPQDRSATVLGRVLSLVEALERMLDERPDLVEPRAVEQRILDEVERELRPEAATLWVPRDDNTYEAVETRGFDVAAGIRVPQEQSLFLSFKHDVDAVLIEPLDVSQRPVSGIPGLVGQSLVAAAVRVGPSMLGLVIATGARFTRSDRERLEQLLTRLAPDLAIAGLIERLRALTVASSPARVTGTRGR
ncbi:MAG: hypothetical protein ABR592_07215 [Nitriliruptorales bacterium]